MRALAILIIAATAVLLGTLWFEPECKGGRVFASEDACAAEARHLNFQHLTQETAPLKSRIRGV